MRTFVALAALALAAGTAHAQVESRRFSVGTHFGTTVFDDAAGLQNAPFVGLDATYDLPIGRLIGPKLSLGLGFHFNGSLPVTRYDQFPAVLFDFGDTTFLYGVAQRVQLYDYGLQTTVGAMLGRVRLYGVGGAGFYSIKLDPRQNGRVVTYTEPAFQLGAGINYAVTREIGLRTEVRNLTFTGFDRDRLDPSVAYSRDRRVMDELSPPVREKSTLNNLRFSLIFSYIPGAGAQTSGGDQ